MSTGHNRARAKLLAKRRGTGHARHGTPSTAPYEAAAALTGDDVGDVQRAIDAAPTPKDLAELDRAAADLARSYQVTLHGTCAACGHQVTVRDTIQIPALAAVAGRLGDLRERLGKFDGRVLQELIDHLGENASLWFTGGRR